MNRLLLSALLSALMPVVLRGAIVYSGSQDVVLKLTPAGSMASTGINLAKQGEKWDEFQVNLWLDMSMMSTMGMMNMLGMPTAMMAAESRLAIYAPGVMAPGSMSDGMGMSPGMGMGMGGILGFMNMAMNLPMGSMIGPMSSFQDWAYLYRSGGIDDEGGYLGILTPDGR